jgi:hypothetical protein
MFFSTWPHHAADVSNIIDHIHEHNNIYTQS